MPSLRQYPGLARHICLSIRPVTLLDEGVANGAEPLGSPQTGEAGGTVDPGIRDLTYRRFQTLPR